MTTSPTIAVAHYPEGAGHATRMLAVADALEDRGAEVRMAGGGAGTRFVALNGYDEFEPATVDYIDTYQDGSMREVFTESVPATAARVTDYVEWLRANEFDALVTDDMFAAIAATRTDVPLYVLKHDLPPLYDDRIERTGAAFHTEFQRSAARDFFYPAVWPPSADEPTDVTRVPPVALAGDESERPAPESAPDVVVVPSHYSELGRVAANLSRQGYDVADVGSDDWTPVASLLPTLRAADVVVCSGYSTVMDAAVAGTPCVVHPATDEQDAVADRLDSAGVTGFAVADDPLDVLDAVADAPDPPAFENGAGAVADAVVSNLRAPKTTESGIDGSGSIGRARRRVAGRAGRRLADRAVAGATAAGTAARVTALRGRRAAVAARRRAASGLDVARRHARRGRRIAVARARMVADAVSRAACTVRRRTARTARGARRGAHRYGTATLAMSVAALVVVGSTTRGTAGRLARALRTAASTLRSAATTARDRASAVAGATTTVRETASAATGAVAEAVSAATDRLGQASRRVAESRRSPE